MPVDKYVRDGDRLLRCGFTTGSAAAMAAAGAAELLLTGHAPDVLRLTTPKGVAVDAVPEFCELRGSAAVCAVRKDGGDDPDATDGAEIVAVVQKSNTGFQLDGGRGVGRVTRPGLDQPVGQAAINSVPRQMIRDAAQRAAQKAGYAGGFSVVIEVPKGESIAEKTFNPHLGIEGGISILGTTGIVEPMSRQAFVDTLNLEIRQHAAEGERRLILVPGNYGADFLHENGLDALGVPVVKFSNYLGEALDAAVGEGMHQVLVVGHIGKLIKTAGGIFNTHSKVADGRREIFTAHAALCGASRGVCEQLMAADTTDACLAILKRAELADAVMESVTGALDRSLRRRCPAAGGILFSKVYGRLGTTPLAKEYERIWRTEPAAASASDPATRN